MLHIACDECVDGRFRSRTRSPATQTTPGTSPAATPRGNEEYEN